MDKNVTLVVNIFRFTTLQKQEDQNGSEDKKGKKLT